MFDNKITADQIAKICDDNNRLMFNVVIAGIDIKFKALEELYEISSFINKVVNDSFVDDEFMPEYVKPMFFMLMLSEMSNIEIPVDENDNTDLVLINRWMQKTNLLNIILESKTEFADYIIKLMDMVNIKIEDRRSNKFTVSDAIIFEVYNTIQDVHGLIKKLGKKINKFNPDKTMKKIEKYMTPENTNLIQKVLGMFDGSGVAEVPNNIKPIDTKLKQ